MPLHETEAFVLRTYTLKEADKICVFLTRDAGKLRGVAHGARKLRSRFGASLEPLTKVALTYFQKENRELVSVSNCDILQSQFRLVTGSESLVVLSHLAKLSDGFLPDHEPNERMFRLIAATLDGLRRAPVESWKALARYFEVWLLKLAGFFPELLECVACRRALAREASIWLTEESAPLCSGCADRRGEELRPDARQLIQEMLGQAPGRFIATPRGAGALRQVGALTRRLCERVLEQEQESFNLIDRLPPVTTAVVASDQYLM
jgi:DNA repair protein RecO (recombination protein O)